MSSIIRGRARAGGGAIGEKYKTIHREGGRGGVRVRILTTSHGWQRSEHPRPRKTRGDFDRLAQAGMYKRHPCIDRSQCIAPNPRSRDRCEVRCSTNQCVRGALCIIESIKCPQNSSREKTTINTVPECNIPRGTKRALWTGCGGFGGALTFSGGSCGVC